MGVNDNTKRTNWSTDWGKMRERAFNAWPVLLAALLVILLYLPVARFGLVWDDTIYLRDLPLYRQTDQWFSSLSSPFALSPNYFRPLGILTFILEMSLGGLNTTIFHLTNIVLHALNALLVALLARRIWAGFDHKENSNKSAGEVDVPPRNPVSFWAGLFSLGAGLLYGLHPALIEGVAFISSRFDLLMTTFLLLGLLAESQLNGQRRVILTGLAFLLAALSKEMAVSFVLVMPFWRLARRKLSTSPSTTGKSIKERVVSRIKNVDLPLYGALLLAGIIYLALRYASLGYLLTPLPGAARSGSILQHVLLVAKSLTTYLRLILWPFTSLAPIHYSPLPIPTGDISNWAALILLLMLAYGVWVLLRNPRKNARQAGWLLLAGLAALLPVTNLLPLELGGGAYVAERFLVFPLSLIVLALMAALRPAWGGIASAVGETTSSISRPPGSLISMLLVAWLVACVATIQLTLPFWHDDLSLWSWAWARAPLSPTPPTNLSLEYTNRNQPQRGLEFARAALDLDPQGANAWNNLGLALFHLGSYTEAQSAFERSLALQPENALYWSNLAGALREQDNLGEAERILLDQSLKLDPNLPAAHLNLGMVYLKADRPDLAATHLQIAAQLLPSGQSQEAQALFAETQDPTRWLRLGELLLNNQEAQAAAQAFDTAARLGASMEDAVYGLSTALIQLEDWENAEAVLINTLQQSPNDARLYYNLGIVYREQGDLQSARQMFEKAVQLAPEWEEAQQNLSEISEE